MTDEEAAQLRADAQEATRVLSGSYTIPAARQVALTEEYAARFATMTLRLLDERAALREVVEGVAALKDEFYGKTIDDVKIGGWAFATEDVTPLVEQARALLGEREGSQP